MDLTFGYIIHRSNVQDHPSEAEVMMEGEVLCQEPRNPPPDSPFVSVPLPPPPTRGHSSRRAFPKACSRDDTPDE
jgi:hypothetical protein